MEAAIIDNSKEWTVEDYLQLEEGLLAQLIEGELIVSPSPLTTHQRVLRKLFSALNSRLEKSGEVFLAPLDLHIDHKNVFQPDLMYLSSRHSGYVIERGLNGPPDLVVEIISPSNSIFDRNTKKKKYLEFGVGEYWIIDPANKTFELYTEDIDNPDQFLVEKGLIKSSVLGKNELEFLTLF
ncbi:MAG: Uma2 family endonuclease [Bacteroidota bacterium]